MEAPRAGPPPGCCGPLVLAPAPVGLVGPPGPPAPKPPVAGAVVDGWPAPNRPPVEAGAVVVGADEVEVVLAGGFPKLPKRLAPAAGAVAGAAVEVLGAVLLVPARLNSPPVAGVDEDVGLPNKLETVVAGAAVED